MNEEKIVERIQDEYSGLSGAQQRIAKYVIEHTENACFATLKEISRLTQTTEVTVLRFCSKFGFQGFQSFKKALQNHMRVVMSPNEKMMAALKKAEDIADICNEVVKSEQQCMEYSYQSLDSERFKNFVYAIKNSHTVYTVGHGVSEIVARYLTSLLNQVGVVAEEIDILDIKSVQKSIFSSTENDLFILISFPYYNERVRALADRLISEKPKVITITDKYSSPIATHAEETLICSSAHPVFYNSISPAISICSAIASALAVLNKDKIDTFHEWSKSFTKFYVDKVNQYQSENKNHRQDRQN